VVSASLSAMRSAITLPFSLWSFIKMSRRFLIASFARSMRYRSLTRLGSNNATSKISRQSPVLFAAMIYHLE